MSTTRVSLADLAEQPHEYSPEERAFRERATDEDLHRGALADPDAQPWTDDMFRRAQAARASRTAGTGSEVSAFSIEKADMSSGLPTWVVTDENGKFFHLQAADIARASPGAAMSAVKIVPSLAGDERSGGQFPQPGER